MRFPCPSIGLRTIKTAAAVILSILIVDAYGATTSKVILSHVGSLGRLNEENRRRLNACGANIRDVRPLDAVQEKDVVTNYHVRQILTIRRELLDALKDMDRRST